MLGRAVLDDDVVRPRIDLRHPGSLRVPEHDRELRPDRAEELRSLGLNGGAVRRSEEGSDDERSGEGGDADHCCTLRTPPAIGLRAKT